jgi:hypothetical protein
MKIFRILAVVTLGLMSLMNVGYPFGTDPKPDAVLGTAVLLLGVVGLVTVSGLAVNAHWALRATGVVAGVNVLGAVVALFNDSQGAVIGLAVSSLALASAVAAGARRRTTSPA